MFFKAILAATLVILPSYSSVIYNNLTPNNLMAIATRPSIGATEIEAADDFIVGGQATVNSASFIGLIVSGGVAPPTIGDVAVEMYRVFPNDSTVPPSSHVPTRNNSPSDVEFDSRDAGAATLSFTTTTLGTNFTASNSVAPGGINAFPNQTTLGNGAVTGTEVQFDVTFTTPFSLPADHYFFVPQVQVSGGVFYWLSASRPIAGAGTTPFAPDLQVWTRDAALDPDWLRVGTDIVGGTPAPQFNAAFSLAGTVAPEPSSAILLICGLSVAAALRSRTRATKL